MKMVKLHFYLLVCCGAAEGFTETSVDLGQNVTLDCDISVKDVYWFLKKPLEPPVFILRSFSSRSLRAEYSNTTFNKSFSLQYNGSLFIHNINTNELGVYYCIQIGSPPDISNGIRLYIQNHSADGAFRSENQTCLVENRDVTLWQSLFIILGIINCLVVVVVVTGFTVRCRKRFSKTQARLPDPHLQLHQENTSRVYAEVQYSTTNGCVRTTNLNSTYALLQPPNP